VAVRGLLNWKKYGIKCQRCKGWMAFEKKYGLNGVFFAWHCVMCGDIIDPVILLHRISQNADIKIPETDKQILSRIKRYISARQRRRKNKAEMDKKS
jgi:hypothetical protein